MAEKGAVEGVRKLSLGTQQRGNAVSVSAKACEYLALLLDDSKPGGEKVGVLSHVNRTELFRATMPP